MEARPVMDTTLPIFSLKFSGLGHGPPGQCMQGSNADPQNFYSVSALLAMQTAVIVRAILSVCPSVMF